MPLAVSPSQRKRAMACCSTGNPSEPGPTPPMTMKHDATDRPSIRVVPLRVSSTTETSSPVGSSFRSHGASTRADGPGDGSAPRRLPRAVRPPPALNPCVVLGVSDVSRHHDHGAEGVGFGKRPGQTRCCRQRWQQRHARSFGSNRVASVLVVNASVECCQRACSRGRSGVVGPYLARGEPRPSGWQR
jgi:hypothetical protein